MPAAVANTTTTTNNRMMMMVEEEEDLMERINICNAPRMTISELDLHELTIDDIKTVEEFENLWYNFIKQYNTNLFPTSGQRNVVLRDLVTEITKMKSSYKIVENELQRQLTFFNSSKDSLEIRFKNAMLSSATSQQAIHNDLKKHLDNIAIADRDIQTSLPWDYFINTLDIVTNKSDPPTGGGTGSIFGGSSTSNASSTSAAKTIRPSNRALQLVDRRLNAAKALTVKHGKTQQVSTIPNPNIDTYNGPLLNINDPDVQLRAYRIDHTLLTTQIKMLKAELDMYDKHMESMDIIGKFLTEHNIWSLLNNNQKGQAVPNGHTAISNDVNSSVVKPSMTLNSEKTKQISNKK